MSIQEFPQRTWTTTELETKLIYSLIVAGKSARFADAAIERLLHPTFATVRDWIARGLLNNRLREARTGNYWKLATALNEIVKAPELDLRTVQPEELEKFHGIGPKTSRFFIIWTRPGERFAALDVHVLRWMRNNGYDAPTATPTGAKYRELEEAFIREADKRGMTPRELDFQIWNAGAQYENPETGEKFQKRTP